jgi:hypothetical protein
MAASLASAVASEIVCFPTVSKRCGSLYQRHDQDTGYGQEIAGFTGILIFAPEQQRPASSGRPEQ